MSLRDAQSPSFRCAGFITAIFLLSLAGCHRTNVKVLVDAMNQEGDSQRNDMKVSDSGGCNEGVCGPMQIVLASKQNYPYSVATDGINVYWTDLNGGTVNQIAVSASSGTSPTILASDQSELVGIATDGINVYWTDEGRGTVNQIAVSASSGTSPTILASDPNNPHGIATDGINVYWTDEGDGSHYSNGSVNQIAVSSPSCTPSTILALEQHDPLGIATDGKYVYWTNNGTCNYPDGGGGTGGSGCIGTVNQIAVSAPSGTLPTILASHQGSGPQEISTDGNTSIGLTRKMEQ